MLEGGMLLKAVARDPVCSLFPWSPIKKQTAEGFGVSRVSRSPFAGRGGTAEGHLCCKSSCMVGIFSRKLSRTIGQLVRFWRTQTSLLIWRWQEPVHVMFCRSAENKRPYVTWPIPFFGFSWSCINLGIRGLCDTSVSIQRGKNYEGNSQIQQTGDSKAYHSLIYLFFSCFICLKRYKHR